MKRMLFVLILTTLVVAGGMYFILRFQAPRGIKIPDALPVTDIPTQPQVRPETPGAIRKESSGSGVLGAETARFSVPDGSVSFRYPSEWDITVLRPGEGTGPYGKVLYRASFAATHQSAGNQAYPNVELEVSEISEGQEVEPLTACRGLTRECGVLKAGNQEFAKTVSETEGGIMAEYATFTDTRYIILKAMIPDGTDTDSFVEILDTLVSSVTVR